MPPFPPPVCAPTGWPTASPSLPNGGESGRLPPEGDAVSVGGEGSSCRETAMGTPEDCETVLAWSVCEVDEW